MGQGRRPSWLPDRLMRSIRFGQDLRQAFDAFYLPHRRIDPRPAATDAVDRRAVSGGVVADRAAVALSRPAGRSGHRTGLWPEKSGRALSPPASAALAG